MEHILVYINWIIYPSMDNRESQSLSYFRNWIQSNKGTIFFKPKRKNSKLFNTFIFRE